MGLTFRSTGLAYGKPVSFAVRCLHGKGPHRATVARSRSSTFAAGYLQNRSCLRMLRKTFRVKRLWKRAGASAKSYHFLHIWQPKILAMQVFRAKIIQFLHLPVHVKYSLLTFRSTGLAYGKPVSLAVRPRTQSAIRCGKEGRT